MYLFNSISFCKATPKHSGIIFIFKIKRLTYWSWLQIISKDTAIPGGTREGLFRVVVDEATGKQ